MGTLDRWQIISSSDPSLSKITFEQLVDIYGEQARALVEGGADLLLLETMQICSSSKPRSPASRGNSIAACAGCPFKPSPR